MALSCVSFRSEENLPRSPCSLPVLSHYIICLCLRISRLKSSAYQRHISSFWVGRWELKAVSYAYISLKKYRGLATLNVGQVVLPRKWLWVYRSGHSYHFR